MDKEKIQTEYEYLRSKSHKAGGMGVLIYNGMASWIKFIISEHNKIEQFRKKPCSVRGESSGINMILADSFLSGNL